MSESERTRLCREKVELEIVTFFGDERRRVKEEEG